MESRATFFGSIGLCIVIIVMCVFPVTVAGADYPLRAKFPMVSPVETEELTGMFGKAVVVDARNEAEFDVIHMVGAKLLIVGKMTEHDLAALRPKEDDRPLVFYCNGITCAKSYEASKLASEWGFKNVRCYDSGIFMWAKTHPEKTEFFGKVLSASALEKAMISDEKFESVLLSPKDFMEKTKQPGFSIIDIRDPNERSKTPFTLPKMKIMSFDTLIKLIRQKSPAIPSSKLLIVDNVGKQARWMQYYFEDASFSEYYFIKGGVAELKKQGF